MAGSHGRLAARLAAFTGEGERALSQSCDRRLSVGLGALSSRGPPPLGRSGGLTPVGARGMGTRILVVDDEPAMRDLLVATLTLEGHECLVANDGREALQHVSQQGSPDLIVLDVILPYMDGRAFVDAYRALPGPHAPILATSTRPHESLSADAFLLRPFELDDLLAMVRDLLGQT
jgi:CheY-like chemotaxis protein